MVELNENSIVLEDGTNINFDILALCIGAGSSMLTHPRKNQSLDDWLSYNRRFAEAIKEKRRIIIGGKLLDKLHTVVDNDIIMDIHIAGDIDIAERIGILIGIGTFKDMMVFILIT